MSGPVDHGRGSAADGERHEQDDLAEALRSGSREDAARALAPLLAGMLLRQARHGGQASSDEAPPEVEALERLPKVLKSLVSARRRSKGGSVRAWALGRLAAQGDRSQVASRDAAQGVARTDNGGGPDRPGRTGAPPPPFDSLRTAALSLTSASSVEPSKVPPLPDDAELEELAADPKLHEAVEWLLSLAGAEDRSALLLLAVEGLDPREAEGILEWPAAVVEQRASRALVALADALTEVMAGATAEAAASPPAVGSPPAGRSPPGDSPADRSEGPA